VPALLVVPSAASQDACSADWQSLCHLLFLAYAESASLCHPAHPRASRSARSLRTGPSKKYRLQVFPTPFPPLQRCPQVVCLMTPATVAGFAAGAPGAFRIPPPTKKSESCCRRGLSRLREEGMKWNPDPDDEDLGSKKNRARHSI
jgi:hypothetical protein